MNNVFFIHIPKCGSVSIVASGLSRDNHSHATANEQAAYYGRAFALGYKCVVVRHPLDRYVSAYSFLAEQKPGDRFWVSDFHERGFALSYRDINQLATDGVPQLLSFLHFRPQWQWVEGWKMDCVLRFERLAQDWEAIRAKFNAGPLPWLNRSHYGPWQKVLSPEAQSSLRSAYARDFEQFGYE